MTLRIKNIFFSLSLSFFLSYSLSFRWFRSEFCHCQNRQSFHVQFFLFACWVIRKRAFLLVMCRQILFDLENLEFGVPFFYFLAFSSKLICFVCNSISRVLRCTPLRVRHFCVFALSLSSFSNYTLLWCLRQLKRIFQLRVISTFSETVKIILIFNYV